MLPLESEQEGAKHRLSAIFVTDSSKINSKKNITLHFIMTWPKSLPLTQGHPPCDNSDNMPLPYPGTNSRKLAELTCLAAANDS
jgi:hypothetical protein